MLLDIRSNLIINEMENRLNLKQFMGFWSVLFLSYWFHLKTGVCGVDGTQVTFTAFTAEHLHVM